MKPWFKFYGTEYLIDPKMQSLTAIEKALWVTILCLASASDEQGKIKYIDASKIMQLTGLTIEENDNVNNFLEKFITLSLITFDNNTITVKNFIKKQEKNLTGYERVKRSREKNKAKND